MFNKYPYTDFHELNLDFILSEIKKLNSEWSEFAVLNSIKWSGAWDIRKQYSRWSIVDNGEGTGYISIVDVPAGITLDNDNYWKTVADYSALYAELQEKINKLVAESKSIPVGSDLHVKFLGRSFRTGQYKSAQGMTTRTVNNNVEVFTSYYNYDTQYPASVIEVMDMEGNIIRTSSVLSIGHNNDMTYNTINNKLYCIDNTNIYELDPDTFTITNTYVTDVVLGGIAFDADKNVYYALDIYNSIYKYDNNFSEKVKIFDLGFAADSIYQSLEYYSDKIFVVFNKPNMIMEINANDFTLSNVRYVDKFSSGYYPVGEAQCISFYEGNKFIINGKPRGYEPDSERPYDTIGDGLTMFCVGDIKMNPIYSTPAINLAVNGVMTIRCTSTTNVFRPTGSGATPCTTLADINLILSNPDITVDSIALNGDFSNEELVLYNRYVNVITELNQMVNVNKIVCYGSHGTIRNIHVTSTEANAVHFVRSSYNLAGITAADYSKVTIEAGSVIIYKVGQCPILDNKLYTKSSAIVISEGYYSHWQKVGSIIGSTSGFDSDVTIPDISHFNEVMCEVVLNSNNRVIGTTICSIESFLNKAAYVVSTNSISTGSTIGTVFIHKNSTTIEIATSSSSSLQVTYNFYVK